MKAEKTSEQIIREVSMINGLGNIILSSFKVLAGVIGHSSAMISDGIHSLSDVFATVVAVVGVRLSKKDADREHPYGHDRLECVASLILAVILIATGIGIGYSGIRHIIQADQNGAAEAAPGVIALVAAIVSIAVKESMFWFTRSCARKIHSSAFMADAWHNRSDAFSSVGALIGILGARAGYPVMDSIASLVICGFILKVALHIFNDAISKMVDSSCPEEFEKEVLSCIRVQEGVMEVDLLHTRMFGEKVYVDTEIGIDGSKTLQEAHDIAEKVHDRIEEQFPTVKHVMVHMNPVIAEQAEQTADRMTEPSGS